MNMRTYFSLLIFGLLAWAGFAFGADEVVVPGASIFDSIGSVLAQIDAKSGIIAAFAIDFLLRYKATRKPLGVLQIVGMVAKRVGDLLVAFGMLVDKILGQRLKDSDSQKKS
jgi:hypothetical protein